MNFNSTFSNPSFKGRREDINNIKSLSENNMPILPNKRQLILSAIDNIGKTADKQDIEMLMGTVETMKYGIQNNSEFAKALGGANGEKENTDWDGILQNTIQNAINTQKPEDKEALQARFQKIFGEDRPLNEDEQAMLKLREDILSSKEMTNVLSDSSKTIEAARVTQNLDYFIASSEINNEDKIKCLGMMKHFLSDDYEINPQLKDYKVQAFSEMVNDLIIKRPDEDAYTIKDVSQKQTGMCAAISIARKTIAYEDKVRAMEIMMAELDNKPTIEVYDRTAIGTGKRVSIEKAHVDFTDGIKKGYRIIDTGTHQWMNAANVVGDGSISIAHYQAFDPDNYEIFRDAKWLNDLPEQYKPAQNWLRYLQKEEGAVKDAARRNADIAKVQKEIGAYKKDYETEMVKSDAAIRNLIKTLDPSVSDLKATTLTRQILKADKLENEEFKLIEGESKESRNQKLAGFIKSELPNVSDESLAENIDKIAGFRDLSTNASSSLAKLKEHSTPEAIFSYNKNLFKAAAHHRRSVEAELNIPERLSAYEKTLNIPVREGLIQDSANRILSNLSSEAVINKTAESFGVEANAAAVKNAVDNAVTTSEVIIPSKLDDILSQMKMGDRVSVINNFLDDAANKIKSQDLETLQLYAENAHVKPDAALVLKKIETVKTALSDNPSNKQIADAVNLLGYNNQIEMTADMYKTFADSYDSGSVSKEQLTSILGNNAEEKLVSLGKEIKSAADKQAQIERQFNLPSRKDVVLSVLEATGEVVPEKTLQEMQAKFDKVAEVKSANDSRIVDPSVKKPKVPDSIYKFTPAEKQIYAQIESKLPDMKTYAKVNAKAMNKALEPQLDALYAEAGRLDGHLWVPGEGESGLYDNQSVKLLEMITGKHYYNEEDIDKVVEHIKRGEGSGTSSTNVDHKRYSGHAQYVAEVSQVAVIDPETKETVMKDVLWHDNTWGRAEDRTVWTDENGVERTDYGNGYGGPDGYVFNKHLLTGTFVEDQKYTPGQLRDGGKFDLWKATRIAGVDPGASEKLDKVMTSILELGSAEQKVQEYEELFKKSEPVDFALMDNADSMMGKIDSILIDKIEKGNFKTQADIDNLKDSSMKFLLEKTAMQMSVPSDEVKNYILNVLDQESLDKLKEKLPEIQKGIVSSAFLKGNSAPKAVIKAAQSDILNAFNSAFTNENAPKDLQKVVSGIVNVPTDKLDGSISNLKQVMIDNANEKIIAGIEDKNIAKQLAEDISNIISSTIDEKLAIKTADDLKKNSDVADIIIKYVDKKFNTSSDSDLNSALQKLQNMTNEEFTEFMSDATAADLGMKDVKAIDVARQINAQKGPATKQFSHNARVQVIMTQGPESDSAPEWAYRGLKQALSPLNNTIQIDEYKKNGLMERQGIRSAFPDAKIMSEEQIKDNVAETLQMVKEAVSDIKNTDNKSEAAAELNASIKGFLSANISAKYQSKAAGLINSYIKALKNNSNEADEILNNAQSVLEQGHITKYPSELIKTFIQEVQSKNPDEDKLAQLRKYMIQAVYVSDIANVEYDLIDNASEALEAMTKETFKDYPLQTVDGEQVPLDSDEGIMYLVDQLSNPANGSTALQVFFAHTGLSERAVDLISSSMDLKSIPEQSKKLGEQLTETYTSINNLNNKFDEFANEKSVAYSSYKDALTHFVKTMDKEYEDKSTQEKLIYSAYKQFLNKTTNADFAKNLKPDEILPALEKIHTVAIQSLSKNTAKGSQQLNDISIMLVNRISAIEALKLPSNSDKEEERQQFINEAKAVYEQLSDTIGKINEVIA